MLVADLLSLLDSLQSFLAKGDSKGKSNDGLTNVISCISPFAENSLDDFSLLILQAQELQEKGEIGEALRQRILDSAKPKRGASKRTAKPVADVSGTLVALRELYANAHALDNATISAQVASLEKSHSAADYKVVAKEFGVDPKLAKGKITAAIIERIGERRRDHLRQLQPTQ